MNRYNNGKIYKLVNTVDDKIYVGSTCMSLAKRKSWHKKDTTKRSSRVYAHLNSIGWDNISIRLIESVNADTKDQLLMREQHYIDLLKPSLNSISAINDCPHNKKKSKCKDCGGIGICIHNRLKNTCKYCGGSDICIHNIRKYKCKDCGGSQICTHNRVKSACKDCGGSDICIHNRYKSKCKDCGGIGICIHNRQKDHCKFCNGDKYYCCECEIIFCSKGALKRHESTKKHKDTYDRMFRECFGD